MGDGDRRGESSEQEASLVLDDGLFPFVSGAMQEFAVPNV